MMGKRFTDTEKWNDKWFRPLPPLDKLCWIYLCDRCDAAGIIDIDRDLANFQVGDTLDWDAFIEVAAGRIARLDCGKIWLSGFIPFQYGPEFPANCAPHRAVLQILGKYAKTERVIQEYLNTIPTPKEREEDKDKDKDRKGGRGKPQITANQVPVPAGFETPEVRTAIQEWLDYKAKRGQPYKDGAYFGRKVAEFAAAGPAAFIAAVNSSIGSNYDGVYPAKGFNGQRQQTRRPHRHPADRSRA